MSRMLTAALVLAILVAGCAGDSSPELTGRCGAAELPVSGQPQIPDRPLTPEAREALASIEEIGDGEAEFFSDYRWTVAEQEEYAIVLFGESLAVPPAGMPRYADASFSRVEGEWRPNGWGQCRIEVTAEGFGNAHWILDRDVAPNPESTTLEIEIMEQACASGQAPFDREIVPVVVEADDAVSITVFVEPVAGGADCQGNPWHPIVVTLDRPLGDRTVFDGASIPPLERTWTPTQSSIDSGGREG